MFVKTVLSCNKQAYLRACSFCKQPVLVLRKIKGYEKSFSNWNDASDERRAKAFNKRTNEYAKILSCEQKLAKLKKLRKMELELAQLCKKCYAQKLECDRMLKLQGDTRTKGLHIYSSSGDGDLTKSGRSILLHNQNQEYERKKDSRESHDSKHERKKNNINYALEKENRSANEILKQIRQESAELATEVKAKLRPSCNSYEINGQPSKMEIKSNSDLTPGDLYQSTSEEECRTVNEMPQLREYTKIGTFSSEDHQNELIMNRENKRSDKNRLKKSIKRGAKQDRKLEKIKRKRIYQKPSTLTEYLYEFLTGRRNLTTNSIAPKRYASSGKMNRNSRQNKPADKKSSDDSVYISQDLAYQGLGAEAILKERRATSKKESMIGNTETQ